MSTMLFSLLLAAAPAASPTAPPAPPTKEKMVCKREATIGSLIPGRRVCLSQSEYRARMEQAQKDTATMQAASGNRPQ